LAVLTTSVTTGRGYQMQWYWTTGHRSLRHEPAPGEKVGCDPAQGHSPIHLRRFGFAVGVQSPKQIRRYPQRDWRCIHAGTTSRPFEVGCWQHQFPMSGNSEPVKEV